MKFYVDRLFRLPRIWSNRELKKIAYLFYGSVINVSAGEDIDKEGSSYRDYFTNAEKYWISNFAPGTYRGYMGKDNELLIDLSNDLSGEYVGAFDLVFNHTTLEHIYDVKKAFNNLCKLSKDAVIIVVPFAQVQHETESYKDYWRFTPEVMRRLFADNGFSVLYESASPYKNSGVYLFYFASKNPERWHNCTPEYEKVDLAGSWIGESRMINNLKHFKPSLKCISGKLKTMQKCFFK